MNRFEHLEVEDAQEFFETTATASIEPKLSEKTKSEEEIWDDVLSTSSEIAFDVFCFFEDLHHIQDYIKAVWGLYKQHDVDLITATVTTESAIALVRRTEVTLFDHLSTYHITLPTIIWARFAVCIYPEDAMPTDGTPPGPISPLDSFIYLDVGRTLLKVEKFASANSYYPFDIPSLGTSYLSHPEMLELPDIQVAVREDEFIIQFMIDTQLRQYLKAQRLSAGPDHATDDMFTAAQKEVWERKSVSAWAVWTMRIFSRYQ